MRKVRALVREWEKEEEKMMMSGRVGGRVSGEVSGRVNGRLSSGSTSSGEFRVEAYTLLAEWNTHLLSSGSYYSTEFTHSHTH